MKIKILIALLFACISKNYASDIITLKNNMSFDGKIVKCKNSYIWFVANEVKYSIPISDILNISLENDEMNKLNKQLKMAVQDYSICEKATFDAKNYHKKEVGHFILGVLFGGLAVLGTAISNPSPEKGLQTELKSKNKDLFDNPEYLKCYKKNVKGRLIGAELLGIGGLILVLLVSK